MTNYQVLLASSIPRPARSISRCVGFHQVGPLYHLLASSFQLTGPDLTLCTDHTVSRGSEGYWQKLDVGLQAVKYCRLLGNRPRFGRCGNRQRHSADQL